MVSSRHSKGYAHSAVLFLALLLVPAVALAAGADPASQTQAEGQTASEEQWTLAVTSDGNGHVYVLYPQFDRLPGCRDCPVPNMVLAASSDSGASWQARLMTPPLWSQADPQIVVDPEDHRTVYATWLQNGKTDVIVAKSTDFGQSWSLAIAARLAVPVVKPVLAVREKNVYAGFIHAQKLWVAASHDGGISFGPAVETLSAPLNDALSGNAVMDPAGNAFFAWTGYASNAGTKGQINLYISKSSDHGQSWATTLMDVSAEPADCTAYHCEWGYLGAQITIATDSTGALYALWNSSAADSGTERIFLASSTTQGDTWSPKEDVSSAPVGVKHVLPTIAARASGNVRIGWMDSRHSPLWTAYDRVSTNGGATWSPEETIPAATAGPKYFRLPAFNFAAGSDFSYSVTSPPVKSASR